MRALLSIGVLADLVACSAADGGRTSDTGVGEDDTSGSKLDSDSADTASLEPRWFGLDAVLLRENGVFTSATVSHRIYSEDPAEGVICTSERGVSELTQLEDTPDPLVWHWLDLVSAEDDGACQASEMVPLHFRLGLGELYSDLVPALAEVEAEPENMYGSYASLDAPAGDGLEGTTYAFGYAGTVANRTGDAEALEAGPLPDGAYAVTGWYLFAL